MSLNPETLRAHYTHFLSSDAMRAQRLLLTGHSHQAWPDVARQGVIEAFEDAALHVDDKWEAVFKKVAYVQEVISREIGAQSNEIALAQNTHELFTRFLSALPLQKRPKIIATDGEFHSVYRQLSALASTGLVDVSWVTAQPTHNLAERLAQEIDERCAAVVCSTVMFQDGCITPHLSALSTRCAELGVRLFLDAYHSFKIVPFSLSEFAQPECIYLSGGGYKYAQWGEGVCWMRIPQEDEIRPIFTGWFSDFSHLDESRGSGRVPRYGMSAAERFAGSTFDPSSVYRAARVAQFFDEQGMSTQALRTLSLEQTQQLIEGLSPYFEILSPLDTSGRAGFIAVQSAQASTWVHALRAQGVFVDARGHSLRFGPAPYLRYQDLESALEIVRSLHHRLC